MADYLQRAYREYGKRKRSAFRSSVKKAYSIVLHSYGLQEPGSSADDVSEESDDNEDHSFVCIIITTYIMHRHFNKPRFV